MEKTKREKHWNRKFQCFFLHQINVLKVAKPADFNRNRRVSPSWWWESNPQPSHYEWDALPLSHISTSKKLKQFSTVLPPRQSFFYRFPIKKEENDREKVKKRTKSLDLVRFLHPSVEIRTQGLLNPIQARYQTSPHPDLGVSRRLSQTACI